MANKEINLEIGEKELCERCNSIPVELFNSENLGIGSGYEFGCPTPYYAQPVYHLIKGSNAFQELKLSAAAGCGLCKLFQDALGFDNYYLDEQLGTDPESFEHGITLISVRSKNLILDNLMILFGKAPYPRVQVRLVILTDQSTTRSIEPPLYVVETESDSAANFALARSWLAECCKDHADCRTTLEFDPPGRLLDIAMPSAPDIIRLVSSLDLPTKGRVDYAALSHCWGTYRPLQTKKDNLESHRKGIPEIRLPQTFHDAVRTTRELGLRYLWIDSLCIVQDEPTDFETECARMNTIFSNALCTISASDARDCRDGLFRSRTIKPTSLTYESDDVKYKLTAIIQPRFPDHWMEGIKGPLQSRAWVLQERHLSPRIIHYTKKCLMWECRTAIASEHLQKMCLKSDAKTDSNGSVWPALSPDRFLDGERSDLGSEDIRHRLCDHKLPSLHDRWYRIVKDYSHRVLSHPEDRLPALSGFAAEWKRMKPEDEYFAGLWKSDIFKGLAWLPSSGLYAIKRCLPESDAAWPPSSPFQGIPSWSWAAFDGPVTHFGQEGFDENIYDFDVGTLDEGQQLPSPASSPQHLHDATTTIEQINPFGRVSKGDIAVSSWSIVVTLSESDLSTEFSTGNGPKLYRLHPDLREVFDGMVCFDHDPFCLPKIQVRLLQLATGVTIQARQPCVCGLALLQLRTDQLTSNRELCRRVGTFHLYDESFWLHGREWKAVTII